MLCHVPAALAASVCFCVSKSTAYTLSAARDTTRLRQGRCESTQYHSFAVIVRCSRSQCTLGAKPCDHMHRAISSAPDRSRGS
eukprot:15450048-Alexandrium_andersonii.AAC.1